MLGKRQTRFNLVKSQAALTYEKLNLSANAAQLSFYILLSLFPMLLVISSLILLLPLTNEISLIAIDSVIPPEVQSLLSPIFNNLLNSSNGAAFSFGLLTAIWSASRCFSTVQEVLNTVYEAKKRRNFIVARLFSFVVTLVLITLFGTFVFLFTFGEKLVALFNKVIPNQGIEIEHFLSSWFVTVFFLLGLFVALFYFIPNVKWKVRFSLPGAFISTIGILFANELLKLYVTLFGESFLGLGSLSLFIVLMLWLYLIMMIFLLGAFVNVVVYKYKNRLELQKAEVLVDEA
ncbi:MAG: YihY/virulence factor BrkB family protein [Vagococcus sp.]|uniref:YihY/virulence factor BrkB family protein n=1 Tax=Vagococcus sp. TaxID=1933889 RepID=UPI002FCC91BA